MTDSLEPDFGVGLPGTVRDGSSDQEPEQTATPVLPEDLTIPLESAESVARSSKDSRSVSSARPPVWWTFVGVVVGAVLLGAVTGWWGRDALDGTRWGRSRRSEVALVPAGTFMMGSREGENGRDWDESLHKVALLRDCLMQKTEVTQSQWFSLMGNKPSYFPGDGNRPVETVNWYEACAYANALSVSDGLPEAYNLSGCRGEPGNDYGCATIALTASTPYATTGWRLPTEAEWEYACRAGAWTMWPFGADSRLLGASAWFGSNSDLQTHPVGLKQPNAWGLHDMSGNVREWCWDLDGAYAGLAIDPSGPLDGSTRVCRGGSWLQGASFTRAADRDFQDPASRNSTIGFRLTRSRH